jgi:hypothetical protein
MVIYVVTSSSSGSRLVIRESCSNKLRISVQAERSQQLRECMLLYSSLDTTHRSVQG